MASTFVTIGNLQTRHVLVEKIFKPKIVEVPRLNFRPVPIEQEPKRNNRFVVKFPQEFEIESFLVQKINRPKLSLKTKGNSEVFEWDNIEIELIDVIGPSTTSAIFNLIKFCDEHIKLQVKREIFI